MSIKITSWNVNSIKARKEHVLRFLEECAPDVLMMQELKGLDFPEDTFKDAGYHAVFKAQKAYNGVAILSKTPITLIRDTLPGDETDEQARYLEVETAELRLINIYLPNGNPAPGDKYDYKLGWMKRLRGHLKTIRIENIEFLIGGDFNVIPDAQDCYDPAAWKEDALFRIETRKAFRTLLHLGLTDAFRALHPHEHAYTFWDYQRGDWQNDRGIRIDHFLLSPELAGRLAACTVDKDPRGWDKPSDHTPITVEIAG